MFTGIIQSVGKVRSIARRGSGAAVELACEFAALELGESVAVDGVCLTVVTVTPGGFTADASVETLARTTLGERRAGDAVNLERALAVGDRLGGHIVAGHVDGVGSVLRRVREGESERVTFTAPWEVLRFVAEKGSVTVDGVSLTVNRVGPQDFDVMVVPFTLGATTLATRAPGQRVNLEADVLARYVARAVEAKGGPGAADDAMRALLQRQGWTDQ